MTSEQARSFRYRYDLDGLRGIAIALVVFYHVFVGRVSGGVDVFLLLSGYFFLGSQLRYAAKPNASLNPWWPIWRTLRRLVPALVLVIGVTYILVRVFTPELMRTELAKQITATMLYYQNWELARQNADYTAASASTSPLQHMWSMSVQGQFYIMGIAFALILAAIMRLRPKQEGINPRRFPTVNQIAGPILIAVTIASFAYASREGLYGSPANYYSTWSRAWELTLGATLAVYGAKWHVPERFSNFFTALGLLCLVFTGALIADTNAYPGPLSLLPLGGAALIIVGGGGSISRAMASKKARWLGDIAYPLYLWHWPLLIITTAALRQETPPWWLGVIIIAVSLVLADLTHRFVERPLRQHRKRPLADDLPVRGAWLGMRKPAGAARAAGGVLVSACVVGLLAIQPLWMRSLDDADAVALDPKVYPGAAAFALDVPTPTGVDYQPEPILAGGMVPQTSIRHCFVAQDLPADFIPATGVNDEPCLFGDLESETEVYLVGGSHAEQWLSGIDHLGREMGFKVVPMVRQGCPIELGDDLTVYPECATWSKEVTKRILDAKPALVISNTTRPSGPMGEGPDYVPAGYAAFWDTLAANDIPFLGLRDNPWGFDENGKGREFDECYVATQDELGCGMTFDRVYAPVDPAADVLAQYRNMIALDTAPWFCNKDGECPVVIGNVMVYRDMHHITNAFADSAMPMLREAIRPFLNGEEQQQLRATQVPDSPAAGNEEDPSTEVTDAPVTPVQPVPYPGYLAGDAV
ncbi:acyltransferase family protein [Corynebacterium sp.]|uniref:acyltransferase family protein n=1 Tax=Corynebacterium sp. TaxID=1720 RepID=UPI0026DCCEA7|nr:acyltransferase family protein [Corynebacterium sp.]MDO5031470.1 acyltransferase family protein [Corynebacterium sp.]